MVSNLQIKSSMWFNHAVKQYSLNLIFKKYYVCWKTQIAYIIKYVFMFHHVKVDFKKTLNSRILYYIYVYMHHFGHNKLLNI